MPKKARLDWRPITEIPPRPDKGPPWTGNLLLCCPEIDNPVRMGAYFHDTGIWRMDGFSDNWEISHWMPVPDPPAKNEVGG